MICLLCACLFQLLLSLNDSIWVGLSLEIDLYASVIFDYRCDGLAVMKELMIHFLANLLHTVIFEPITSNLHHSSIPIERIFFEESNPLFILFSGIVHVLFEF